LEGGSPSDWGAQQLVFQTASSKKKGRGTGQFEKRQKSSEVGECDGGVKCARGRTWEEEEDTRGGRIVGLADYDSRKFKLSGRKPQGRVKGECLPLPREGNIQDARVEENARGYSHSKRR